MTRAFPLKVGDKVCIGKQPLREENLAYYGAHAVITEVSHDSIRVDFEEWSRQTGAAQTISLSDGMEPKAWFMSATVWKDEGTRRLAFLD